MHIDKSTQRNNRIQHWLFLILFGSFITGLAWLSTQYVYQADWTENKRNTASDATQQVLDNLTGKVEMLAFISEANNQTREDLRRLISIYQRIKPDIQIHFIDPTQNPEKVRELEINFDGEVLITYEDRRERLQQLNEQSITNALNRLARKGERWVTFLTGHKERKPGAGSELDYALYAQELKAKGLKTRTLNLATDNQIPHDTSVLIIADPQQHLLPGEVQLIQQYVDQGGNIMWLIEPGSLRNLDPLAERLGIDFITGIVVDLNTQLLGIDDPRFALVAEYPRHPVTQNFDSLTLFPIARAIEFNGAEEWDAENLLETLPRSWAESDEIAGEITFEDGLDVAGPLVLGLALTRLLSEDELPEPDTLGETETPKAEQRVIVVGDADFLSDTYLGQGGNLDLGLSLINWLVHDDQLINIPAKTSSDNTLEFDQTKQTIVTWGFLVIIPLLLLASGVFTWWKRKRRT